MMIPIQNPANKKPVNLANDPILPTEILSSQGSMNIKRRDKIWVILRTAKLRETMSVKMRNIPTTELQATLLASLNLH